MRRNEKQREVFLGLAEKCDMAVVSDAFDAAQLTRSERLQLQSYIRYVRNIVTKYLPSGTISTVPPLSALEPSPDKFMRQCQKIFTTVADAILHLPEMGDNYITMEIYTDGTFYYKHCLSLGFLGDHYFKTSNSGYGDEMPHSIDMVMGSCGPKVLLNVFELCDDYVLTEESAECIIFFEKSEDYLEALMALNQ